MKVCKLLALASLLGGGTLAIGQIVFQENFQSWVEAVETVYQTVLSTENTGNSYLNKWVTLDDARIASLVDPNDPGTGSTGLAINSNSNGAQRAAFYVIDGSSISAGSGTLTFDILDSFGTMNVRIGVWEVSNGPGTAGNSNIYDSGQAAGTQFSDTTGIGVFGQNDATSSFLLNPASDVLTGTNADDLVGTGYTYNFTYTGGDIVIGFGVEMSNTSQFTRRVIIDNISVAVVPEPATFALLAGFATLGLVLLRRRKSRG